MINEVYKYIKEHSTSQSEALNWLEKQTNIRTNHARMLSGSVQGQFLKMLAGMIGAKRILELGTFTGYSAICLASGMSNGIVDTIELNDELEDLILEGFERAALNSEINLHIGDCKSILKDFKDKGYEYDLVYIDANKREYCEYYELVWNLVRQGGYIIADNVLWDGKVSQEIIPNDKQTQGIARFNDMIVKDERVENVILPLRDGMNLIVKRSK